MGVSTDAILVFGMQVEDESEDSEKIESFLGDDEDESGDSGWQRVEKAQKKTGAEIVYHCSGEYQMYIVGVHQMCASRGYPVAVDPEKLERTERELSADLKAIESLCDAVGISFNPKKCKWWLCSNWS